MRRMRREKINSLCLLNLEKTSLILLIPLGTQMSLHRLYISVKNINLCLIKLSALFCYSALLSSITAFHHRKYKTRTALSWSATLLTAGFIRLIRSVPTVVLGVTHVDRRQTAPVGTLELSRSAGPLGTSLCVLIAAVCTVVHSVAVPGHGDALLVFTLELVFLASVVTYRDRLQLWLVFKMWGKSKINHLSEVWAILLR